jgi:hypothetical protein
MTELRKTDFDFEVAKGNISGHRSINKFGHNPEADAGVTGLTPEDCWGGGGLYDFYPSTAISVKIHSNSSDDDANAGIGARWVLAEGLNSDWEQTTEMVSLDGTTSVGLANKYIRMFRAFTVECGSTQTNASAIIIQGASGSVACYITEGHGQTQQAIYTIAGSCDAYFKKGYVGLGTTDKTAQQGIFQWKMRLNNSVQSGWLTQGEISLMNTGTSYWQYEYGVPAGAIPAKTDIRIELTQSSTEFDIVGGFDLILVDN